MNKQSIYSALCGAVLLAVIACEQKTAAPPPAAPPPPAPVAIQQASEEIKATYQWYCAQCHGVEGRADGINARLLTVMPRNHTEAEYLETRSDDDLFRAIKHGGVAVGRAPCMPKWGHTLDDETIRSLVLYIRELCKCKAG